MEPVHDGTRPARRRDRNGCSRKGRRPPSHAPQDRVTRAARARAADSESSVQSLFIIDIKGQLEIAPPRRASHLSRAEKPRSLLDYRLSVRHLPKGRRPPKLRQAILDYMFVRVAPAHRCISIRDADPHKVAMSRAHQSVRPTAPSRPDRDDCRSAFAPDRCSGRPADCSRVRTGARVWPGSRWG
jgi:hypothetical protein